MNKIAIFPYDEDFSPFLINADSISDMEIKRVFSVQGWGYIGKSVCAGAVEKLEVENLFDIQEDNTYDVLAIVESEHILEESLLYKAVEFVAQKGKNIWIFKKLTIEQYKKLKDICHKYSTVIHDFLNLEKQKPQFGEEEIIYDIGVPVIAVAGMGEKTNKAKLQVDIYSCLCQDGYKAIWVSSRIEAFMFGGQGFPHFMYGNAFTEKKKILLYNHYLKWLEQTEQPDVILIGIPGGIMPDSKKQVGNFGITAFEILNAIVPDYFIMSLYCCELGKKYLDELQKIMKYKFNAEIDCFYVSDTEQDAYSLNKITPVEYVQLESSVVQRVVEGIEYKDISIYHAKTIEALYRGMIDKLGEYSDCQVL